MRSTVRERGFTLTELLVVVSIVVLLTALSLPALVRMGAFSSNHTSDAARDYYQMLRAARQYATTNNVETALVYQTRLVYEPANDGVDAAHALDMVPIIDAYVICRRATIAEIQLLNTNFLDPGTPVDTDELVFIPVTGDAARFRSMREGTCILPDVFEVVPSLPFDTSTRGLSPVFVVDPAVLAGDTDETGFLRPLPHPLDNTELLHFEQSDGDTTTDLDGPVPDVFNLADPPNPPGTTQPIYAFPAHRFAPSGEMLPQQNTQRIRVRIGMLPSTIPQDRFVTFDDVVEYDETADPTDAEARTIQFHRQDPGDPEADPETMYLFHDPRRGNDPGADPEFVAGDPDGFLLRQYLDNVSIVTIYPTTGRVKIEPTVEPPDLEDS